MVGVMRTDPLQASEDTGIGELRAKINPATWLIPFTVECFAKDISAQRR